MSKFCPNCGEKQDNESSKFCPNCGANLSVNSDKTKVNKSNNSIKCSFIPFVSLISFILGIYLLTRPNKEVHKHGIIIIVLTIIVAIIAVALWIDYINYVNAVKSYSYYDSYYY